MTGVDLSLFGADASIKNSENDQHTIIVCFQLFERSYCCAAQEEEDVGAEDVVVIDCAAANVAAVANKMLVNNIVN